MSPPSPTGPTYLKAKRPKTIINAREMKGRKTRKKRLSRVNAWILGLFAIVIPLLTMIPAANAAPFVTSIAPTAGPIGGGTSVVITGTGFEATSTVTFGGTAATSVVFNSATELVAVTPAKAAGTYNVVVTNPSDSTQYTFANAFTYTTADAPSITTISPTTGPVAGGTVITITGTNFVATPTVTIGGTAATGIVRNSATEVIATTPAKAAGTYVLVLTNPDGQSYTKANAFTYSTNPFISTITPNSGSVAGGTIITITGTGFTPTPTVTIGGTAATGVTFNSDTELVATTPAKPVGTYSVVVTNTGGGTYTKANAFTYVAVTNPTITSITPNSGALGGGTVITIVGSGFNTGATVTIGGTAATGVVVADTNNIQATTPAKTAGTYNVVVTNTDGGSRTLLNGYTYVAAPTITNVAPTSGTINGGTTITITGTGFNTGITGTIDGTPVTVTRVTSTRVTFVTPAHAAGPVSIVLTNTDTQSATSTSFSYGLPGEPGFFESSSVIASTSADSGKYADIYVEDDLVVVVHSFGGAFQAGISVSTDGGVNYASIKVIPGTTGQCDFHLAVIDAQKMAVSCGARISSTRDGGISWTHYSYPFLPASQFTGGIDIDTDGINQYVGLITLNCGNTSCGGVHTSTRLLRSDDAGLTWPVEQQIEFDSGGVVFSNPAIDVRGTNSWIYAVKHSNHINVRQTSNAGTLYTNLPDCTSDTLNDIANPISNYGDNMAFSKGSAITYVTFRDNAATANTYVGEVRCGVFTKVTATGIPLTTPGITAGNNAVIGITTTPPTQTSDWFQLLYTTPLVVNGEATSGNPTSKPWATAGVWLECPVFWLAYQDPVALTLKVVKAEKGVDCGGASGNDLGVTSLAVTNLVGFDMDSKANTIITREDNGPTIKTYNPFSLEELASADSFCTEFTDSSNENRRDGVSAYGENVAYIRCESTTPENEKGIWIRSNLFLDPIDACSYCGVDGDGKIDENGIDFIDVPENIVTLATVAAYPYSFDADEAGVEDQTTNTGLQTAKTRVVFTFTEYDTGKFGVYAVRFQNNDFDIDGTTRVQFAPDGQTIMDMCSWRTDSQVNGESLDLIAVAYAGTGIKIYTFDPGFSTGVSDLNPTITLYLNGPSTAIRANAIECMGDKIAYATDDGKIGMFYVAGTNKGGNGGFNLITIEDQIWEEGIAIGGFNTTTMRGGSAIAVAIFDGTDTTIKYYNEVGTLLGATGLGPISLINMKMDRIGSLVTVGSTTTLFSINVEPIICLEKCTDTNPFPGGSNPGTGGGGTDEALPPPEPCVNGVCATSTTTCSGILCGGFADDDADGEQFFFWIDMNYLADGFNISVTAVKWLLGLFVTTLLIVAMAARGTGFVAAILAGVGAVIGIGLSIVFGLYPIWLLLLMVLMLVVVFSKIVFGGSEES